MKESDVLELHEALLRDNPWWKAPHKVPGPYLDYEPRPFIESVYAQVTQRRFRRAPVLMGPRRVGKTVMLYHSIARLIADGFDPSRIAYVSLDMPVYRGVWLQRLVDAISLACGSKLNDGKPAWVFFDEIQYLKDWEVHLKTLVDQNPVLKFVASGSAGAALKRMSSESGAGRFTDIHVPPLMFAEFLKMRKFGSGLDLNTGALELWQPDHEQMSALNVEFEAYVNVGGFPEYVNAGIPAADLPQMIGSDIATKAIARDLPSLYGIEDTQELERLFVMLAVNTGQEISLEKLASNSRIAKATITRYLTYLEAAYLVRMVRRVDQSGKSFRRDNFLKAYLYNPSFYAALYGAVKGEAKLGCLVETAVFAQHLYADERLHYARWDGGRGEVDIVVMANALEVASAVEVKWSDRPAQVEAELGNLLRFCTGTGLKSGTMTTRSVRKQVEVDGIKVNLVPCAIHCLHMNARRLASR